VAVALVACSLGALPAPARARTPGPNGLRADGAWLGDPEGRARILHGVNVVYKHPPYLPSRAQFGPADARLIRKLGFNVVRLGIIWKGLEPRRDHFDLGYLNRVLRIIDMLAREGVFTLLDFHQDIYNERYGGEGFPDWAVFDDGLWTGAEPQVFEGWAGRYLTPGVGRAFDNFWENRDGIQDELIEAWTLVAALVQHERWVVGFDLLNEPWPGSMWGAFQTPLAEALRLQPFYERAIAAIREVDPWHVVWWEPSVTNNFGATNGMGVVEPFEGEDLGMSFHVYCLAGETVNPSGDNNSPPCEYLEERAWDEQQAARDRLDHTWFLSEFGATDDLIEVASEVDRADDHLVGWAYWAWKHFDDPTGAIDEGLLRRDTGPLRLKPDKARVLSRPYAQIVAGRPEGMDFDAATGTFELAYEVVAGVRGDTVVYVPVAMHYPKGYRVTVRGARVVSRPNASSLVLRNLSGADSVTLTLTRI
jgi:endoglycosylceramidase